MTYKSSESYVPLQLNIALVFIVKLVFQLTSALALNHQKSFIYTWPNVGRWNYPFKRMILHVVSHEMMRIAAVYCTYLLPTHIINSLFQCMTHIHFMIVHTFVLTKYFLAILFGLPSHHLFHCSPVVCSIDPKRCLFHLQFITFNCFVYAQSTNCNVNNIWLTLFRANLLLVEFSNENTFHARKENIVTSVINSTKSYPYIFLDHWPQSSYYNGNTICSMASIGTVNR